MTVYVIEVGGPEAEPWVRVSHDPAPLPCPTCGHFGEDWPGGMARLRLADKGEARRAAARLYQRATLERVGDVWRVKEGG